MNKRIKQKSSEFRQKVSELRLVNGVEFDLEHSIRKYIFDEKGVVRGMLLAVSDGIRIGIGWSYLRRGEKFDRKVALEACLERASVAIKMVTPGVDVKELADDGYAKIPYDIRRHINHFSGRASSYFNEDSVIWKPICVGQSRFNDSVIKTAKLEQSRLKDIQNKKAGLERQKHFHRQVFESDLYSNYGRTSEVLES